jgi:hypothetical protein
MRDIDILPLADARHNGILGEQRAFVMARCWSLTRHHRQERMRTSWPMQMLPAVTVEDAVRWPHVTLANSAGSYHSHAR